MTAHELRNPMVPVSGQVELLLKLARRLPVGAEFVAGLERLDRAIGTLLKRAVAVLNVSRISSGQFRPEFADVDLSDLAQQSVAALSPLADRAGSPLQVAVQGGVSGCWDRLALEQVTENLISNAIKYGAGQPIAISLTSDTATARLSVRDHGVGISADDQARIFGRFEQAVRQRPHGGFGMGLWVAQQLVSALHGEIAITSQPGAGSDFIVALPLQQGMSDGDRARG